MSNLIPLLSSKRQDYGTPRPFYDWLDGQFHFTRDVCASKWNAKHPCFWTVTDNALHQDWSGITGWANFPYGRGLAGWLQKARDACMHERAIICQLLPARVGARWWRRYIMCDDNAAGPLRTSFYVPETRVLWLRWEGLLTGVYFHHERLEFEGGSTEESAPFDTAVVWHASPNRPVPAAARDPKSLLYRWPR